MFNTLVNAKAKIVRNKKLNTLRLIVAFNVYELNAKGTYKFPPTSKCAYVSGDLQEADVLDTVKKAEQAISAKIVLV